MQARTITGRLGSGQFKEKEMVECEVRQVRQRTEGQQITIFPGNHKIEGVASNIYRNIHMLIDNRQDMRDIGIFKFINMYIY